MSVIATAVRHLMAAGVTGEALVQAIADMEAEIAPPAKQRSAGAIRQERYRERHKASQSVTTVTNDGCDDAPALSRPPNENISNPPTHTHLKNKPARVRAVQEIPEGWQPASFELGSKSRAIVDGWPPGEIADQIEHFTAHHRGKGSKFKDWQDAWSTWVLNSRKFGNGRSGQNIQRSGGSGFGQRDNRDGIAKALDRRLAELEQPAGQAGRSDIEGTASLRLIASARTAPF